MQSENDYPAVIDYAGTGETPAADIQQINGENTRQGRSEPAVLVELAVVDGVEGQKLHAIQAEIIRRILTCLAERQAQGPEKESRL